MQPPSQCRQSALAIGVVPRALPTGRNASRWTAHATHRSSQVAFVLFTIQSMAGICV
uniref:Uncharacterized protein n=2 Tax=Zea mays TaxID=4577 RepID=B6SN45_MAIZE|nr:hypothetical protein [Zea mays]ACN31854.1 unknown [Zea mays]